MKATELMIGDWVQLADGNKQCVVVGIKCDARYLEKEATLTLMDKSGRWFEKQLDDIKPIPLTPEILEKNGFVKGWTTTYELVQHTDDGRDLKFLVVYKLERKHLRIDSYTADTGIFSSFGISFVHQLQHALRLCQIDKTIEL